jgi:hypothetical protein
MKDRFAAFPAYLTPGAWPYWPPNPVTGVSAPGGDPWSTPGAPTAAVANGGLLGNLGAPSSGLLGSLAGPFADVATAPSTSIGGFVAQRLPTMPPLFLPAQPPIPWSQDQRPSAEAPYDPEAPYLPAPANQSAHPRARDNVDTTTPNAPQEPPRKPSPPFYGPGDVLMPPPEPAVPEPLKDFRAWLRDVLSDENTRYYAGPHLFEALRKLHALTQLLPGSGMVQSMQDSSRAGEEAQAGNYGKAAAQVGMGTLNAALDWFPAAKLALILGVGAKTFPRHSMPIAEKMEAAGISANEIWNSPRVERNASGTWTSPRLERNATNAWTSEISDKSYHVRHNSAKAVTTGERIESVAPLFEHHVHPGLQRAYPELSRWRSLLVTGPHEKEFGSTNPKAKLIQVRAPDLDKARYVGIHELQHLIDWLERHAPGGSPRDFIKMGFSERQAYDLYRRLVGEVVARNAQRRLLMPDDARRLTPPRLTERIPRNQQINLHEDRWWEALFGENAVSPWLIGK